MNDSGSILPEDWDMLAPIIDELLDEPPENRDATIDRLSNGDAALREKLRKLALECEEAVPILDRPASEGFAGLLESQDEPPPPPLLGGRYEIVREVGRGGMARVFLARDTKHGRDVAVKIIRRDVAATLGSDRFLQEIAIAARLRHPNIVPMYDSGDTDGVLYFVMPYEEGLSLKARLVQDPPIQLTEKLSILLDVARALAYAHERGVVHRDVKPDNVLLSGGAAVVADFGIAKAVSAAQAESPDSVITGSGARIGTPMYIAPEQGVGDPATDHRADIYSFGCLGYELLTGSPPFRKSTAHELITAHVSETPFSIRDDADGTPPAVAQLIMRCLEKLPSNRPQTAQELVTQIEHARLRPDENVAKRRRMSRQQVIGLVIAVAVIVGFAAYMKSGSSSSGSSTSELTVAVLPLVSSGDSLERELAYGLSDEIATALFKSPGVRVMSRRGAAASRDADVDPQKTGQQLGARFLVTGSLRQAGESLTVMAKLIDVSSGAMLWAERFDGRRDDLAKVRDEIARSVGDSLTKRSGAHATTARAAPLHVPGPEPYRLYVLAQRALSLRGQNIQASADMFRRATELDTLYAEAFGGLSLALALAPYFKPVSSLQVAPEATAAAHRALRLDPSLAQPHVALGIVNTHAYKWDSAARELQIAVRLRGTSDVEPLVQYGRLLMFGGNTAEAQKQFLAARDVEPASAVVRSWVAYSNYLMGNIDSAIVENRRAFQADSTNLTTLALGSLIFLKAGNVAGAKNYVRRNTRYNHISLFVLSATGDTLEARARIAELVQRGSPPWQLEISRAFAFLGARDTAQAIDAFERATDAHDIWPSLEPIQDPMFDAVRSNARFHRVLRRVGLR
ncbi:MAG TPA: protein kinase [Gemmatimonadaceae bacterium]|nr:protein kinase [Gemmatimonadaceae bacterium]